MPGGGRSSGCRGKETHKAPASKAQPPQGVQAKREKSFWKVHDVQWPGGHAAHCSASRDRPGSAVRIVSAAAIFSWGAWGMGQNLGESPPRTCSHMWPGGVWPPPALPAPWEPGGAHHAHSSTVKPPQTWLMPGIDGRVPRAEARLQQTEDGTREGQGLLAPGWPAPAQLPKRLSVSVLSFSLKVCPFLDIRSHKIPLIFPCGSPIFLSVLLR